MTQNHYDMMNQILGPNHEIGKKLEEIMKLRTENEWLNNELKSKKEKNERLMRSKESIKTLDEQLRGQRQLCDTSSLGYTKHSTTEKGESSKKLNEGMCTPIQNPRSLHSITVKILDTQKMSVGVTMASPMLLPNLMVIIIIAISMDLKHMSVDQNLINPLRSIHSINTFILATSLDTSHKIIDLKWSLDGKWEGKT